MKRVTFSISILFVCLLFSPLTIFGEPPTPMWSVETTIVDPLPLPVTLGDSCTREHVNYTDTRLGAGEEYIRILLSPSIPEGRLYVIESATVFIRTDNDTHIDICQIMNLSAGGGSFDPLLYIPLVLQQPAELFGYKTFSATIAAKVVVSSDYIAFMFEKDKVTGGRNDYYAVAVNGYYVDADCAQP